MGCNEPSLSGHQTISTHRGTLGPSCGHKQTERQTSPFRYLCIGSWSDSARLLAATRAAHHLSALPRDSNLPNQPWYNIQQTPPPSLHSTKRWGHAPETFSQQPGPLTGKHQVWRPRPHPITLLVETAEHKHRNRHGIDTKITAHAPTLTSRGQVAEGQLSRWQTTLCCSKPQHSCTRTR